MSGIKKKMDSEESRLFWESCSDSESTDEEIVLPSIGDDWWEAENELSPALLPCPFCQSAHRPFLNDEEIQAIKSGSHFYVRRKGKNGLPEEVIHKGYGIVYSSDGCIALCNLQNIKSSEFEVSY